MENVGWGKLWSSHTDLENFQGLFLNAFSYFLADRCWPRRSAAFFALWWALTAFRNSEGLHGKVLAWIVFFYSGKTLGQSYYCTFTIVVVVGGDGRMGGTS